MRAELIETAKTLPETFNKIMLVLNGDLMCKAMEYYTNFVKEAHTENEVTAFGAHLSSLPLVESNAMTRFFYSLGKNKLFLLVIYHVMYQKPLS